MELKLKELHIKNYKLFKDLEIPKLGRVNLITGKNNTGKTILLEALRIWASEGDASVINNIIWTRGDWEEGSLMKTCASLFTDRIIIDRNSKLYKKDQTAYERSIHFNKQGLILKVTTRDGEYVERLEVFNGNRQKWNRIDLFSSNNNKEYPQDKAIFVPASIEFDNKKLWANIDLTDKKDSVIQILQIIEPSIMDLGIIDNVARVRTKDSKIPVPLKNFGEGLNRLLTIAMALVSAEDNLLLIDEIDTGLHYSVLEKLWEIIFKYAGELNAQVFVTTHSGDCVNTFSTIANRKEWEGMGNYFRLSRKDDGIVAVDYGIEELEMALESNIETR